MIDDRPSMPSTAHLLRDLTAGLVVFLVALPLCLGIALASGAPLFSGVIAGIVGGIVVGAISGSHTSVSGPAAGLTAIVAAQITSLGSFEAFLLAVMIAGTMQIAMGLARAGALAAFFPSSVIKGLLAAIGVILILKQIPHLLGHDSDPEGEMSFVQPDQESTLSELVAVFQGDIHWGAALVGVISLILLVVWSRSKRLSAFPIPAPLIVVLLGVLLQFLLAQSGGPWTINSSHLVQIPVADSAKEFCSFLRFPDLSLWNHSAVYIGALTIAVVASLETLLNLEAVDKLDPENRNSPPSRELIAQGIANVIVGMIGGIPVTSVIVRSSVNVNAGAKSKAATIFHGILLLVCVALFPVYLNLIPLAALAAILIVTGFKLASPKLFRQMWSEGFHQLFPFLVTLVSIVFTDLLIGILIGLGVSILFILNSNLRQPIRRIVETHLDGDIVHIELANQVSFLNRAAMDQLFNSAEPGTHLALDASDTNYIDHDILSLIREFKEQTAPARGIKVSLRGFRDRYQIEDEIQFADYSTRELQDRVTPQQVLNFLKEGNLRFRDGRRLTRDFGRQIDATASGQNPLAVILSCIDSRVPAELIFDLGIGDIFSVRVAGNVIGGKSLGSIEYGVSVAGVKLVLVLGHTHCGAVTASVKLLGNGQTAQEATGCSHIDRIVHEIEPSIDPGELQRLSELNEPQLEHYIDEVARRNVVRTVDEIVLRSAAIRDIVEAGNAIVVGAMYDVKSGNIEFLND